MGTINYEFGPDYRFDPATSQTFQPSPEVGTSLSDRYAFFFNTDLQDLGYAPFATLVNETRGTSDSDLDVNGEDYAFFLDFQANTGSVTLNGGVNNDVIFGGSGNDHLLGDDGNDLIFGGGGRNLLEGGNGDDQFYIDRANSVRDTILEAEGAGRDGVSTGFSYTLTAGQEIEQLGVYNTSNGLTLTGNEYNQTILGGSGRDVLTGAAGRDTLTGAIGGDRFVYNAVSDSTVSVYGRDTINDFSRAQGDRIDLRGIDAFVSARGNQSFSFIGNKGFSGTEGELQAKVMGAYTLVSGDVDGNGRADFALLLKGQFQLTGGDFFL